MLGPGENDWFKEGTIFLDEIADLSLEGQARIIEVLPRAENVEARITARIMVLARLNRRG